jgi:hypothetical protein
MKKLLVFFMIVGLLLFVCSGCEKDATGLEPGMARLNVYMTDAAALYDSVNITFSQVSAHIDSQWITITGDPVTVDLLEWTNGNKLLIGSADVPAGKYTQVRVIIDDAEIGIDDTVHSLTVPSGAQTGLKFGPQFVVEEGSIYELVFDFDVNRSIVVNGPKKSPKGYKLKPHMRMIATAVAGSISGVVTNPKDLPIAYAIQSDDIITSSLVDTTSGYFMLGFLNEGEYTVSIVDTNDLEYNQDNVMVIVGENNDLGLITLE